MRKGTINASTIQAIEIYTTVPKEQICLMVALETGSELLLGFRQGCLLSLAFFNMSLVVRKPVLGVSDQVQHKPGCTATEDG